MRRAPVPETAVDEDGDFGANERDIGSTAGTGQRDVDSVSQTDSVQRFAQGDFTWCVTPSRRLHTPTNVGRRRFRSRRLPVCLLL
jgi:hypothetical protein